MNRFAGVISVVVIVTAGLAVGGCGAAGNAVVRVGDNSISKATIDHWTAIQRTIDRHELPLRPDSARDHVLAILITYQWLLGEGKEQQLNVSDGEVAKHLALYRQGFNGEAGFRDFLRANGKTAADESLIIKIDLLLGELNQRVAARYGAENVGKFFQNFPKKWTAKTSCASGYVVPNCRQYHGPESPKITT